MDGSCDKHLFERRERNCRSCGGEFCGECLVYAYGPKKPPYCVSCALAAAGVRSSAARPVTRSRREMRREAKEARRAEKLAARASEASSEIDDLLDAAPLGAEVEFEFTITDDGTIEERVDQAS